MEGSPEGMDTEEIQLGLRACSSIIFQHKQIINIESSARHWTKTIRRGSAHIPQSSTAQPRQAKVSGEAVLICSVGNLTFACYIAGFSASELSAHEASAFTRRSSHGQYGLLVNVYYV
ncbi:hypothetical protein GQ600_24637 [Phytophthora cactorum]|nr:hypothetical protein GQ600_24637 [Phytophthora cactorum]